MTDNDNIPVELRCGCGSLIARVLKEGVEIKCRRCKQVTIIPLAAPAEVKK